MSHDREQASAAAHVRAALERTDELARLRDDVLGRVGFELGGGVLYGIGFMEGLVDGRRVVREFLGSADAALRRTGPALGLRFEPRAAERTGCIHGEIASSSEALVHLSSAGAAPAPACFVSSGYSAGWYTELCGAELLVRETRCRARGDASCRFEARPIAEWLERGDGFIRELLPYLDLPALRERAAELVEREMQDQAEGTMLGGFDPLSPAAHVWGPVVVLPYSGPDDSTGALETILGDVGRAQLRVAVIDATGLRIDPTGATGLAVLVDRVTQLGLEPIVAGVGASFAQGFRTAGDGLSAPLFARNLAQGIALGFQLCQTSAERRRG
jgi:hypothetical protein